MPNWRKVIVSGSDATLNTLTISNGVQITGSLSVTGSTTQAGTNNLFGNTTLSGSIIISGSSTSPPTPTIKVYGDMETNGVIKFLPIAKSIDTSISASYIYVSGSTNDLYFSQNGQGYNNVTRLRWLEGNLYTGLLNGGLITTQSSTVYKISSGSGIIVNLNASLNNDPFPTIQYLNWGNLTGSINAFTSSYQQCFVGIDSTNNIFAQGTPFSNGQFDTIINIGGVFFQNQTSINAVKTQPSVAYGFEQQQNIFTRAFGALKLSGYTLSPSGSSTGSLVVGSGTAYAPGANYAIDPNEPSYTVDTGTNISKIFRYRQSGSTWVYDTNAGAGYATIDPSNYSNSGVLTTVQPNDWSIQRVFWFPNSIVKAIVVYYGNESYSTEADAIANTQFESFIEAPNTAANAIYLGAIIIKGNGVFTTPADFKIQPGGLFRQVGGAGGGGSTITQTLAGLSDVAISGPTNGQPLVYNTAATKWQNQSVLTASLNGNATTATTAATASYIAGASVDGAVNDSNRLGGNVASYYTNASNINAGTINNTYLPSAINVTSVTASFSGNLTGTASYATQALSASYYGGSVISASFASTASYVLNAISASYAPQTAAFPYTGSAIISGSLIVTGSLNAIGSANISGSLSVISGSFSLTGSGGSRMYIGKSNQYPTLTAVQFEVGAPTNTNWNILGGTSTMALNSPGGRLDIMVSNNLNVYFYDTYAKFRYSAIFGTTVPTPSAIVHVRGAGATSATTAFLVQNSTPSDVFKVTDDGKTTIAASGFPLIVNSTNSNTFKMTLQDNGVTRGYFGSGTGIPLMIGDSVGNPTHTFYGTGTISSLGGIYIGSASTTPSARLHSVGSGSTSATTNVLIQNSSSANLFRITDDGRVTITGSLGISGGITGSLLGTASYANQALSASWAPAGAAFPYTGSAQITGSLVISGSNATRLTLLGSGSALPIFTVQGSQGELFSITDSLSGSLFSVNDISGLPILEVFSDNTTLMGDYQAPALYTTKKITASSGVNLVYSLSTGSYDGVFMDYIIRSGSNSRAGNFSALWGNGATVNYMDNSTTDFGSTSGFTFGASISGSNMIITGSASTTGWTIKSIIRSI